MQNEKHIREKLVELEAELARAKNNKQVFNELTARDQIEILEWVLS